jgi:hypothetical protein
MHWYGKTKHSDCAAADLGLRENLQRGPGAFAVELGKIFANNEEARNGSH